MEEPILLCIETSSPVCSVAIAQGNRLLDELISDEPNGHSRSLAPMLEQLFKKNTLTVEQVSAVAVNAGPGSYTGLRIGMSTAKGLCYALDLPLITLTAFECMVHAFLMQQTTVPADYLLPMIDARRMEVYTQLFSGDGIPIKEQQNYISGEDGLFPQEPPANVFLFGSGAQKMVEGFQPITVYANGNSFISATNLIGLAYKKYRDQLFADIAYTTPNYGKEWQK